MPEKIRTMEAPPLFVIGDEGPELVNYRVHGKYYVVDRLFNKAELQARHGLGRRRRCRSIARRRSRGGAHG